MNLSSPVSVTFLCTLALIQFSMTKSGTLIIGHNQQHFLDLGVKFRPSLFRGCLCEQVLLQEELQILKIWNHTRMK